MSASNNACSVCPSLFWQILVIIAALECALFLYVWTLLEGSKQMSTTFPDSRISYYTINHESLQIRFFWVSNELNEMHQNLNTPGSMKSYAAQISCLLKMVNFKADYLIN